MKTTEFRKLIREEVRKVLSEAGPDYTKVDQILAGTYNYKKPASKVNPEMQKMADSLDKLTSKKFDADQMYAMLEVLAITPKQLRLAINAMKHKDQFELSGSGDLFRLIVTSKNYTSKGAGFMWNRDAWE